MATGMCPTVRDGRASLCHGVRPGLRRSRQAAQGTSRIYVNGELAGSRYRKAAMSVVKDVCMNIGGWRGGNYRFVGEIDEVRVSRVARTADWMKLQYENQNPMQSLVGPW